MCKIFKAIHKLAERMKEDGKGNKLAIVLSHSKIVGYLHPCDDCGCYEDVITLKDAKVICMYNPDEKHSTEWINIPTYHIQAFTFHPCECCK